MSDGLQAGDISQSVAKFYDMPVTLEVRLGEATLPFGEILKCGKGSIIQLNQKIGEAFTVILHNKKIAEGEIVETGEHLGLKITKIHKQEESEEKQES